MPVRSLFLCVWVWWLQLTALQSERLLLLGALQYSEPPATELVWINFLCVLFCQRPGHWHFAETISDVAVSSCAVCLWRAGWERGRAGNVGRTKAQGWNSFRGSSQPEQHSVSCFFIGSQGGSLYLPIGWKLALRFCKRTKGLSGWLVLKSNKESIV